MIDNPKRIAFGFMRTVPSSWLSSHRHPINAACRARFPATGKHSRPVKRRVGILGDVVFAWLALS
jgi:hypothetical protein